MYGISSWSGALDFFQKNNLSLKGIMKEKEYKDKIKTNGKRYFSTKGEGRGLGLIRIDDTVNRYNGYINRKHEEGVFATEIVLPIED